MQKIINFSKDNQDVLPHLEKQYNMSAYVVSLIRQDMEREQQEQKQLLTREQVVEIIKDVLSSHNFDLSNMQDDSVNSFPIDAVMGILSMDE